MYSYELSVTRNEMGRGEKEGGKYVIVNELVACILNRGQEKMS